LKPDFVVVIVYLSTGLKDVLSIQRNLEIHVDQAMH
jgi:hypothetical protein